MTQHAKKPAYRSTASHKKLQSSFQNHKAIRQVEGRVLEMEREGLKSVVRATRSMNKVASEYVTVYGDNLTACIESGNTAAQAMQNIGTEIVECCNRAFTDFAGNSREAIACRSLNDLVDLHNEIVQRTSDDYLAR